MGTNRVLASSMTSRAIYKLPESTDKRLNKLKETFLGNFVFGPEDEHLKSIPIHDLGSIEFNGQCIDLIGIGSDLNQRDRLLVNLQGNLCETPVENFELDPNKRYAIEGVAGLGKSTLIKKLAKPVGTDLQELRDNPKHGVLMGQCEDNLYYRLKARTQLSKDAWLIDRSNYLAATVYGGYIRKSLFVYLDKDQIDFITDEPYETLVLLPDVMLETVAQRIKNRNKMDRDVPFDYTVLTFSLFNIVAFAYGLPLVKADDFERQCKKLQYKTWC